MAKITKTFWIDEMLYKELKSLIDRPIGTEIDDLMRRRIAEIKGGEVSRLEVTDYEALKREHGRLVKAVRQIEKHLQERRVLDELVDLATDLNLNDEDFSNLKEVSAKILKQYRGSKEDTHMFITLLEAAKEKRRVERKLEEIRSELGSCQKIEETREIY